MAKSTTAITASSPSPNRILFARIGWMTYYDGPGVERPIGGGAYNRSNTGHEVFNFAKFDGHLYGFVGGVKAGHIKLARIEPSATGGESLDDVLIIFVARQRIVGWYKSATVYADINRRFPAPVEKEMRRRLKQSAAKNYKSLGYNFEASVENATLLPLPEREKMRWKIPGNVKGGFGEYNIRYPCGANRVSKYSTWMKKAGRSVLSYAGANLLIDRYPELSSEEAAEVAEEKGKEFQSNPIIRRIIEEHAMAAAKKTLEEKEYCDFTKTAATKPYDYTCLRNGKRFFVEVKGTQTTGSSIILTKNEVEHVKANVGYCILVVVHSIQMDGERIAAAGVSDVTEKWNLKDHDLTPSQFVWKR